MLFIRETKLSLKQGKSYNIVILAAGASTRLGSPKQLLVHEKANLLQHAIDEALDAEASAVLVVLGSEAQKIAGSIEKKKAQVIINEDWQEGMSSSIRKGVEASGKTNADAVIIMVCDQPYVSATLLKQLASEHFETGKPIVASQYKDTLGTPVLFHESFYPALLGLQGDVGAKKIIMDNKDQAQAVKFPLGEIDIDEKEDLEKMLQKNSGA